MDVDKLKESASKHILNTYGVRSGVFTRGEGCHLWDDSDKRYLDFFTGIAVTNLGHAHPDVTAAIQHAAATLMHTSNLYLIPSQIELAELLCANSTADRWFFCNSGAEANEAAIKMVRRYWHSKGTPRPTIVTMRNSFHGRTLAAVTATGQPKYHEGFAPLPGGFTYAEFGDIASLESSMSADVGAIMVEPVQGEGGIRVPEAGYLKAVRDVCDRYGALMVVDEVQSGMGRTGKLFAHQHEGITPDVITVAKGLGNGVPIGALGCTEEVSLGLTPGTHGCTFGGNQLVTAAAVAVMKVLTQNGFLDSVATRGTYFAEKLNGLAAKHSRIAEVRTKGLMIGVELDGPASAVIAGMFQRGIVCGPAGANVVRFLPPLIAEESHFDEVIAAFDDTLEKVK